MDGLAKKVEMRNQHIARQLDLVPPNILDIPVTVLGAGAIGSWVTIALAKMGFSHVTVFDYDDVDIVNMSSQFFKKDQINTKKVEALANNVREFTGDTTINAIPERWQGMQMRGVVVMAVDSMEVRKQIFEAHRGHSPCDWLIDARMGSETALLYTVNPNSTADQSFYEKTLYTDAEAVQERCTAKSTTYCALVLGGLVAKTVRDVLVGHKYMRNMTFSLKEADFLSFNVDLRPQAK